MRHMEEKMQNNQAVIVREDNGHNIVFINNILFYGKKNLPWSKVEDYLKKYIGDIVEVSETGERIHIGKDFPDEFKGSEDTKRTRGANAKAKANSVQGIHEMIRSARKISENENRKEKNKKKASNGWYRYLTRFALPVTSEEKNILYYSVYLATLIVRVDGNDSLYLYDVINIKKEKEYKFS